MSPGFVMSRGTLFMRLVGPMQSWGHESTLTSRGVGDFPTRSAVTGLACAALGVERTDEDGLRPFHDLRFAVCELARGVVERDFQTVSGTVDVTGKDRGTLLSPRWYRCGAAYLAAFEGDANFLERLQQALLRPRWPLFLGRKSHVPAAPVALKGAGRDGNIERFFQAQPDARVRCLKQVSGNEAANPVRNPLLQDHPQSFASREFSATYYQEIRVQVAPELITEFWAGLPGRPKQTRSLKGDRP